MLPHGPDAQAFEHASTSTLVPVKLKDTMAFMFETRFPQRLTKYAAGLEELQIDYIDCWHGLRRRFNPSSKQP
jgi:homogentisate 1,2-dioxygenase